MTEPRTLTDHHIDLLWRVFARAFRQAAEADRESRCADLAGHWVGQLSAFLNGQPLTRMPETDPATPPLPFLQSHHVSAEAYTVARGGMRGGPPVDVLLQIWFDTEDMLCGYGIPMLFHRINARGRMPETEWTELAGICRHVLMATPAGRLVFFGRDRDFSWTRGEILDSPNPIIANDMHSFAGTRLPPAPIRGRGLELFCRDLASGWAGDPALSGLTPSALLDDFLATCHVQHLLRVRIGRDRQDPLWRQSPLPRV